MTVEEIKNELFCLSCKDRWNSEDWKENNELTRKLNELEPQKPAEKQEQYELVTVFSNGNRYREGKYFTSVEDGIVYAETHDFTHYELVKC